MNALDFAKSAASMIVGIGTSKIVHSIIDNNVETAKAIDTVTVAAGSLVLGSMAADATKKYLDAKIDGAAAWFHSIKEKQND